MSSTAKSHHLALGLTFVLPGAGHFYLGRRSSGLLFAGAFLLQLLLMMGLFIWDFAHYLNLAGDASLLQGNHLEAIAEVFHKRTLVILLIFGLFTYTWSMISLFSLKKRPHPFPIEFF